jgi:hypothetical protein
MLTFEQVLNFHFENRKTNDLINFMAENYCNKMELSDFLFWDVDKSKIDYQKHARYVIERVLTLGLLSDWYEIKNFYGLNKIKNEALQIRYLDKVTLNFCSQLFNEKKEHFRCYTFQQSGHNQHWNY